MTGVRYRHRRAAATAVALILLLASCGGSGGDGGKATEKPGGASATSSAAPSSAPKGPTAAPRWEELASFDGREGDTTEPFTVAAGAIQWRVRWSCEGPGSISITGVPALKKSRLVQGSCPEEGVGYAIQTGPRRLQIEAAGPWKLTVDQQVDTPVDEPALPEMATAKVLGSGDFYDLEKKGKGTARLYQLGDGRRALRFEGFDVTQNTDLFVWLSEAPRPETSAEVVETPYVQIAGLRSTVGSQNYIVPAEIPTDKIRSVVIWCEPVRVAYAAAALNRT